MSKSMKWMIYEYLIDAKSQCQIVRKLYEQLNLSDSISTKKAKRIKKNLRNKVSYYTRILEKEGYIIVLSKKINPKIYKSTSLTPKVSEDGTSRNSDKLRWEFKPGVEMDVHHLSYEFDVTDSPKRKIHWDRIKKLPNGVIDHFLYWESAIGKTTIRYRKGSKKEKVTIWLPSLKLTEEQWEHDEPLIRNHILKAAAWAQKLLLCRLGLPQVYRKPHFAYPIREPELKEALQHMNISLKDEDETHMDSSPPSGEPCFESNTMKKTRAYAQFPDRLLRLEEKMERMEAAVERLDITVERLIDNIEKVADDVTKVLKKPDKKLDEDLDMFG